MQNQQTKKISKYISHIVKCLSEQAHEHSIFDT